MFEFCARKYCRRILIPLLLIFTFCCFQFSWWNESAAPPSLAAVDRVTTSRVLIFSYHRSGSTFFSSLLSQPAGAFLHFEPLVFITGHRVTLSAEEEQRGLNVLRHAFRCDFHSVLHANTSYSSNWLFFYRSQNHITWPPGFDRKNLSKQMVTAIEEACQQHPVQVAKIVRPPLESVAGPLLEEFADLKVIFLVRDPRPMYHSRWGFKWCEPYRTCIDPREFCAIMERDLEYFQVLKDKFPGRVLALRYEDLVVDLKGRTEEVFDFLNWDYAAQKVGLEEWLRVHTEATNATNATNITNATVDRDVFNIVRSDSASKAEEWRTTMTEAEVRGVEEFCGPVINILTFGNFSTY